MPDNNKVEIIDAGLGRVGALVSAGLLVESIKLNNQRIIFTAESEPEVTIVIVSHNAPNLLCMTLANLANHKVNEKARFEVIVVDNKSDRETLKILSLLDNVQVIHNNKNEGFGPACNQGARLGRGRFILFLNPDMDILPGALDAMVEGFDLYDEVGIVGARLVFPGGMLQEAGAFFMDDAQLSHPYLRGHNDPSAPEALFAREVGYVSGAALMIRRDLFDTLDGFDDVFAPAYFEDTDLCLRCAQLGQRVVFQPRAVAFHYENATSPSREHVEKLLSKNKATLLERHRNWLFETGAAPTGFMVREPDRNRFRVLYIDDQVPHIDGGGGLPRANSIVNMMIDMGYFVTVLPMHNCDLDVSARYRDINGKVEILRVGLAGELKRVIQERSDYYDLIWISRPHNIDVVVKTFLECGASIRDWVKSRIVFDTEALFSTREAISSVYSGHQIDSATLKNAVIHETSFSSISDVVVSVSEAESKMLQQVGGVRNTRVLGHMMEAQAGDASFKARNGVLFVGPLDYEGTPNVDSIDWFLKEAWSEVARKLGGEAKLYLVGTISDKIRKRFERSNVIPLGRVANLDGIFNSVRVAIAPTRFAAGIPQKVHNCVGHGVPMVISPLLRAQLNWMQGTGCLSAGWQKPADFVDAVVGLHQDEKLWASVRARGLEQIAQECDKTQFKTSLRNICEEQLFV